VSCRVRKMRKVTDMGGVEALSVTTERRSQIDMQKYVWSWMDRSERKEMYVV